MVYAACLALIVGPVIMALALAFGVRQNKNRNLREIRISQSAARALLFRAECYDLQKCRSQPPPKRRGFIRRRR